MISGDNPLPGAPRHAMETTMNKPTPCRVRRRCAVAAILVAACATPPGDAGGAGAPTSARRRRGPAPAMSPALADAAAARAGAGPADRRGQGAHLQGHRRAWSRASSPAAALPPRPGGAAGGRRRRPQFRGRRPARGRPNILGDILNESYTIDAAVGGQVTIRTSSGIPRDALPATLETLLRMNGATMVKEAGSTRSCRSAAAVRGNVTPQLGNSQRALPPGFSVQIVPLRYVGVREMMRILEPFAKDAQPPCAPTICATC